MQSTVYISIFFYFFLTEISRTTLCVQNESRWIGTGRQTSPKLTSHRLPFSNTTRFMHWGCSPFQQQWSSTYLASALKNVSCIRNCFAFLNRRCHEDHVRRERRHLEADERQLVWGLMPLQAEGACICLFSLHSGETPTTYLVSVSAKPALILCGLRHRSGVSRVQRWTCRKRRYLSWRDNSLQVPAVRLLCSITCFQMYVQIITKFKVSAWLGHCVTFSSAQSFAGCDHHSNGTRTVIVQHFELWTSRSFMGTAPLPHNFELIQQQNQNVTTRHTFSAVIRLEFNVPPIAQGHSGPINTSYFGPIRVHFCFIGD